MTVLKPLAAFLIVAFSLASFVVLAGILFGKNAAVTNLRNKVSGDDAPRDDEPGTPLANTDVIDEGTSETPSATTPTAPIPSPSSPTPSSSPTTSPPPAPVALVVNVTGAPASVHAYYPIRINWTVAAADGNESTAARTGIAYAAHPVPQPIRPADYGNETAAYTAVDVPQEFNRTFTHADAHILYLRAYARFEDTTYYWSDEVEVNVTIDTYTVTIEGTLTGARYEPDNLTVRIGDAIQWTNEDAVEHTATNDTGTPEPFDTGPIAAGETSDPLSFTTAGTYTYHCEIHPEMQAQFQVEEPPT